MDGQKKHQEHLEEISVLKQRILEMNAAVLGERIEDEDMTSVHAQTAEVARV